MSTTQRDSPDTPGRRNFGKTALLIGIALLVFIAAFWAILNQRSPLSHMYVVVRASDSLKIEFLQPDPQSVDHCRALANRVAETMLAQCAACRVLVSRCLGKLDARQSSILSGQPVDMPVMRTPTGTVAFISEQPELANAACQESERQASGNLPVRCVAAGVASSAVSLARSGASAGTAVIPNHNGSLVVISIAALISALAAYLVLRAGRTTVHSVPGSMVESSFAHRPITWTTTQVIKRSFDILLATILLLILSPVMLLAGLLILMFEGRPVFYISQRYVSQSKSAPILKFRTMVIDATDPKHRLYERFMHSGFLDIPLSCEVYTPIGRLLERTQLVETPQLLNILFHGLSFVGNRPLPAENVLGLKANFSGWAERFDSPAGITGITQVVGKLNLTPNERIKLESLYSRVYKHGNILKCDLKIILITAWVVLFSKGIMISEARELLRSCLPKDRQVQIPSCRD